MNTNSKTFFTSLNKNDLKGAVYAVLPGDPGRVEELAFVLDNNAKLIAMNRQHISYLACLNNQYILITSTGMGCPAIALTVEELADLGIQRFIRVGTCGTIQESVNLGDIIITKAAVKLDNTSKQYLPEAFPAVPSFNLTYSFIEAAKKNNIPYHVGITVSSDTFWPGQERYDNFSGYVLRNLRGSIDEWRALNVLNFEMEASALFTTALVRNVEATVFCGVIAKRTDSEKVSLDAKKRAKEHWECLLKKGILEYMMLNK